MFKKATHQFASTFPAQLENLKGILSFVSEAGQKTPLSAKQIKGLQLVVEEICTNIIRHSYLFSTGEITVKASLLSDRLTFSILDQGQPFDPTQLKEESLEQQVQTERKGGLGLKLIKKLLDEVEYKYEDGQNQLRLTKMFPGAAKKSERQGKRVSLQAKILWGAVLVWSVLSAVFYSYMSIKIESSVKNRILATSADWANTLACNAAEGLMVEDDLALSGLTTNFVKGKPGIAYLYLVDSLNTIWASPFEPSQVLSKFTLPFDLSQDNSTPALHYHPRFGKCYHCLAPIMQAGKQIGTVHLGLRAESVDREVRQARKDLLTGSLLGLIIGWVGIVFWSRLAARPIRTLRRRIEQSGSLAVKETPTVEDEEIGRILKAFEETTTKIKIAQQESSQQEWEKKEFELAQEIRQALIPKEFPLIEGVQLSSLYNVAKEIGGDYFDFIRVDEKNLGLAVADIAGKGVSASLIMSAIRTALRLQARQSTDPVSVLEKVDSFISPEMPKGMFVTMFYGIINLESKEFKCASAGHNPGLLFKAKEKRLLRLNPKGLPLGLNLSESQLQREVISIQLEPGDLLLLYTDGITECRNLSGEQFGSSRLTEFIQAHNNLSCDDLAKLLEQKLAEFAEGSEQRDDVTLVLFKLEEIRPPMEFRPDRQSQTAIQEPAAEPKLDQQAIGTKIDDPPLGSTANSGLRSDISEPLDN
jgi:serine phosphatase RsbU (regulator of sigma subunit)/anti-sigma regulatory factor (Ser/Thr protein kinase)